MSDEPNVELRCLTARSSNTIMSVGSLPEAPWFFDRYAFFASSDAAALPNAAACMFSLYRMKKRARADDNFRIHLPRVCLSFVENYSSL